MRRLILFRHAKTEPFSETGTDETRRLTERGHEDARMMGQQLKIFGYEPDCVLVSAARRTRETWAEVQTSYPDLKAIYREELYLADPDEIAAEIAARPDCATMLVIGHNEGLHEFALQLAGYGGTKNQDALARMRVKYPTAAIAVFEAKEDDPFNVYNFELVEFLTAKDHRD